MKLKNKFPEPMQYTRAIVALGVLDVCLENLAKFCNGLLLENVQAMQQLIEVCQSFTQKRKKPLSRGAQRAFSEFAEMIEQQTTVKDEDERAQKEMCVSLTYTAFIFILDAYYFCSIYTGGDKEVAWQKLASTLGEVVGELNEAFPKAETMGDKIYDDACQILAI